MALYPFIINDNIGVKKDILNSYFNSHNNTITTTTRNPNIRINSSHNNSNYNLSPFASNN
jgi:hypothetical protein